MRMSISDDGIGIDPSAVACENRPDHFGLLGMRERAQELGASLYIGSNGLKGTRVTLSVPTGDAFSESKSLWRDSTRRPLREPFIQGEGAGASQ
jgi:nitrate/nitrite-specific signal transduction histidine kinase